MKAEIISVGTELILGEIIDTNAPYLASQLPQLGVDLYWVTQVGDNKARLVEALQRAWGRSDLVLVTGGLGPTEDDVTRECIAEMLGEQMAVDPDLENWLRDLFAKIGQEMPERNLKQATLIPSASALPNPRGSAPGWWVTRDGKTIVAMPGPPGEMQRMWRKEVRERLRRRLDRAVIQSRTLKLVGIGEANVDEMLSPLLRSTNPTIGVYARLTGVELRLTAKARTTEEAERIIAPMEEKIRAIMGDCIWGVDDQVLEKVVGDLLLDRGLTIAIMESCTGGLLANLITDVPGSSRYFKGGLVAYSNEVKIALGVSEGLLAKYGAVSSETAEAMAKAARDYMKSDVGVGVTGVAGPEPVEGKPVGTIYIGLTDGTVTHSIHTIFPQHRVRIKRYAAVGALAQLRRLLLDSSATSCFR